MEQAVSQGGRVLSDVLPLLRIADGVRALLKESAKVEGLTPVQAQALLFVARTKTFLTSIGNLAAALGATHVTAVKVAGGLVRRGLLERTSSRWDRRVTLLCLTAAGEASVARLGSWETSLERALAVLGARERASVEPALGAIVRSLQQVGAIVVSEPCRGCIHFEEDAAPGAPEPHRCRLIERHISAYEARRDCPDHTPAAA